MIVIPMFLIFFFLFSFDCDFADFAKSWLFDSLIRQKFIMIFGKNSEKKWRIIRSEQNKYNVQVKLRRCTFAAELIRRYEIDF